MTAVPLCLAMAMWAITVTVQVLRFCWIHVSASAVNGPTLSTEPTAVQFLELCVDDECSALGFLQPSLSSTSVTWNLKSAQMLRMSFESTPKMQNSTMSKVIGCRQPIMTRLMSKVIIESLEMLSPDWLLSPAWKRCVMQKRQTLWAS